MMQERKLITHVRNDVNDLGRVKLEKLRSNENDFLKLNQIQLRTPIFQHLNALSKNVYSIVVARRRVLHSQDPKWKSSMALLDTCQTP
jgi:hypothetical protein